MPQPATQVVTFQLPSSSERASRSISSGCNGSQGRGEALGEADQHLPAPVLSAARAASSAAPVMPAAADYADGAEAALWLSCSRREQGGQVIAADGGAGGRDGRVHGLGFQGGRERDGSRHPP